MTVELKLSIKSPEAYEASHAQIPATIRSLTDGSEQEVFIPIGNDETTIQLEPGPYLVEAFLPSGEMLRRPADLSPQRTPYRLQLRPSRSSHEWLAFQHLLVSPSKLRTPRSWNLESISFSSSEAPEAHIFWAMEQTPLKSGALRAAALLQTSTQPLPPASAPPLLPQFSDELRQRYDLRSPDFLGTGTLVIDWPRFRVIVPMPGQWPLLNGSGEASIVSVVNTSNHSVSTTVGDPSLAPLLGYLAAGHSELAARALGVISSQLLFGKYENPFAAAAGAYVLVQSALSGDVKDLPWRRWVTNLANFFPLLPDGAILEGWVLLSENAPGNDTRAKAVDWFIQAHARGVPYFAAGLRLLLRGLLSFAEEDVPEERRAALAKAQGEVRRWATWLEPREAFTTLRVPLEKQS